ncbi:MAG: PhzF family phenazine biosynthesis protein [Alphaproteobacteria bacterium]|nr:PhzF family phenazine biosynthesis protein [Alphaproteobacteria bacterium]
MQIPIYQVDAFADRVFRGNPAAVCPLDAWLPDATMQAIAAENNLSETAFFVRERAGFALRWFTPLAEVELCGHATLASAFVIATVLEPGRTTMTFTSRSGPLAVARQGDLFELDFPALPPEPCTPPAGLDAALGAAPRAVLRARKYLALYDAAETVAALAPDMAALATLHPYGVIVSAPGTDCDFVSRYFAPSYGIPEDPVTGSAHSTLIPYWSRRLGRPRLDARQLSRRGGVLVCEDRGDRVGIGGRAVLYLAGTIALG